MSNVKPLTDAETAERIDQTLGGALEGTRSQVAEIVAERDRLRALVAELVDMLWKAEPHLNDWPGLQDQVERLIKRAKEQA